MIDVSNPSSFPIELQEIVHAQIELISELEFLKIKNETIEHKGDVICLLENSFSPGNAYQMYQEKLIPIFKNQELLCFHATRVGSYEAIINEGLFSDIEKYNSCMRKFLQEENVTEEAIRQALQWVSYEYKRKYGNGRHQICFFTNYRSLHNSDGYASYDQFCETVGGELASWALENRMPDVLTILRTKGHPVIVKFKIPFEKIADYNQDSLIYQFVLAVAAKELWNYDYSIEADCSLIGDVLPSDILELIPAGK